jgi:uncharacterized LabA/DUF88 family protein
LAKPWSIAIVLSVRAMPDLMSPNSGLFLFMDRSAIFVDAGYLWAAGGLLTCGTHSRARVVCDCAELTTSLATWVHEHSGGLDSLRTYWYDGAVNGVPTTHHEQVGSLSYVKVRLGRLIQGQQKGVDALIYRDLMTLSRERAIARAYLLSGDEDLREGVVAAQDMGVQVVLLGIPTTQRTNQSAALIREADEHVILEREFWQPHFTPREEGETSETSAANPAAAQAAGRQFADRWAERATAEDLAALMRSRPRIPRELDIELIVEAEKTLGSLRDREELKRDLRAGFWSEVESASRLARASETS